MILFYSGLSLIGFTVYICKIHGIPKAQKGVGMIRAEIGLKNTQIINEMYSFRCFLIL